jgi:hypothetical protein
VLLFLIPHGVWTTALGLEEGISSERFWQGPLLLFFGIIGFEMCQRGITAYLAEASKPKPVPHDQALDPEAERKLRQALQFLFHAVTGMLQFISLMFFLLMLDGHVHFRAALYLYSMYVVGAIVVWAIGLAKTPVGKRFLQWGWAINLAFGVPLCLPLLKSHGLVPFNPII